MNNSELNPTNEPSPTKELNLFYIIDVSGSMGGKKIEAVNDVMPQVMGIVEEISGNNKDNAVIKANVLTFNDNAKWVFPKPIYASEMKANWQPLAASGGTSYGQMCLELEKALHRDASNHPEAQLNSLVGHKAPAIILMSDGQPLDSTWENQLKILNQNSWYDEASKIAIAIGDTDTDLEVLRTFVGGGVEAKVYTVHNVDQLRTAIKVVSAVTSHIGSEGKKVGKESLDTALPLDISDPDGTMVDDFD